ncbi:helix-turn-helix transcriptional regulator [Kitasatospora nipponensis]|uniref:Helix-turn-helix transcriptional regulator n=1 Tax=Kitasatospora nipponensis TaxID=258049 RepID=A0ABN1X213_9ACTN
MHGYGILAKVDELSQESVGLKVGTLYGVLARLVEEGLVEPHREEHRSGRLRRYHRLTEAGRDALAAEAHGQAANARVAIERLGAHQPATPRSTG